VYILDFKLLQETNARRATCFPEIDPARLTAGASRVASARRKQRAISWQATLDQKIALNIKYLFSTIGVLLASAGP
jgi:hypothetical protein